jgi:hypothetical protein
MTTFAPVVNTLPDEVHEICRWQAAIAADERIEADPAIVVVVEVTGSLFFTAPFRP